MDFSKVLWSSFRETDKIYHIERFTVTLPANSTYGEGRTVGPSGHGDRIAEPGKTLLTGYRTYMYYKPSGSTSWLPVSAVRGSAYMSPNGMAIGQDASFAGATTLYAHSMVAVNYARSAEVVFMAAPIAPSQFSMFGRTFQYVNGAREIRSNTQNGDVKWSSFDKQATIAGTRTIVYASDGTPKRIATIAHGQGSRPMVRNAVYILAFTPPATFNATGTFDFVRTWRDNTNIYVEYEPPAGTFPQGEMIAEVWWYHER